LVLEDQDNDLMNEAKKLADELGITLTEVMLTPRLLNLISKIIQEKRNKS
jgi:hypothetical protein